VCNPGDRFTGVFPGNRFPPSSDHACYARSVQGPLASRDPTRSKWAPSESTLSRSGTCL
jgi:hypothetical protein